MLDGATDDDVLRASTDEQLTVGEVPKIAGVQPSAAEGTRGCRLVGEVSVRHAGPSDDDTPFATLGEPGAMVVQNPDLVTLKRSTARDDTANGCTGVGRGRGSSRRSQRHRIDAVHTMSVRAAPH